MPPFAINICFKHSKMNPDTAISHPPVLKESCRGDASCGEIRLLQESHGSRLVSRLVGYVILGDGIYHSFLFEFINIYRVK